MTPRKGIYACNIFVLARGIYDLPLVVRHIYNFTFITFYHYLKSISTHDDIVEVKGEFLDIFTQPLVDGLLFQRLKVEDLLVVVVQREAFALGNISFA